MQSGQIANTHNRKCYGYISYEDNEGPVYFHFEDYEEEIPEIGQDVTFEVDKTDWGMRAYNIEDSQ
ncbi:cold shock domain-containing protein [Halorientalis brevis]|uniref:Cold shock domain-containing protein n=1 Tax=Halorientalis brevis TaxID=1126241 RepID=A0ABD6CEI1_9EURY|nr:cold shock domain-containing protein [Halorientalis brevis]